MTQTLIDSWSFAFTDTSKILIVSIFTSQSTYNGNYSHYPLKLLTAIDEILYHSDHIITYVNELILICKVATSIIPLFHSWIKYIWVTNKEFTAIRLRVVWEFLLIYGYKYGSINYVSDSSYNAIPWFLQM